MRATVVNFMVNVLKDDSLEVESVGELAVREKRIGYEDDEWTWGNESLVISEHHGQSCIKHLTLVRVKPSRLCWSCLKRVGRSGINLHCRCKPDLKAHFECFQSE